MSPRAWAGLAALCLAGVAKAGCTSDSGDLASTAGAAGAAKAGADGRGGRAGGAGAGAGGKVWGAGGVSGKAGASGGGGCPEITASGVDGFVPVAPCPKNFACGPGCSPIFSVGYRSRNLSKFRVDPGGVVDTAGPTLLYRAAGATETQQVGMPESGSVFLHAALSPSYLVTRHYTKPEPEESSRQNYMHIYDRATGKLAHWWSLPGTEGGPSRVYWGAAATDKYVLLSTGASLLRFDLMTGGAPKVLADSNCYIAQIVNGQYLCADDSSLQFTSVDIETGERTTLAPGPEMQVGGSCAFDGSACAWVDYRDPPGDKSTFDLRMGGEVYRFDLASRKLERLTFDSPATPHTKYSAVVEGDWVVWQQRSAIDTIAGGFTVPSFQRLYRDDRATGTRCWYPLTGVLAGELYQHKLYALWYDPNVAYQDRVVAIDLDSPEIPWECGPAPAPVVVP
ncbi:MAG: hypothetical protein IT374_11265 [Polyangiaceae bacterium]|nr:hypothetical protein [Polyangiaceae bacterium]